MSLPCNTSLLLHLFIPFQLLEPQSPHLASDSFAHPSPRFPSLEKSPSPETGAQRQRRGPSHLLYLGGVCVHTRVSTRHHLHFDSLQSDCTASKEGNKWCKGIYIPSKGGCWSVRFHLLLRGAGVQGSCCGMEGSSLGLQVEEGHSQLCSQPIPGVWLRDAVVDGDPCVRLCKMPAFTFHREG